MRPWLWSRGFLGEGGGRRGEIWEELELRGGGGGGGGAG